jgi:hypothetical protein
MSDFATLFLLWLPVIFAVLRGLAGIAGHIKAGDLKFDVKLFAGSVALYVIIATVSSFGLGVAGLDSTEMVDVIISVFASLGIGWKLTDVVEDVVRKPA